VNGLEGAIYAGLETLTPQILGRGWKKDGGTDLHIERCLVDANWEHSTEVVYRFCRHGPFPAIMMPSHSRFVGAGSKPFSEYERKLGERAGWNLRVPVASTDRPVRHVVFDSNFWKSFVQARLAVAMGDRGSLTLFGDDPNRHRLLADHLRAEYRVRTSGRGRTVDEWKLRPEQSDYHWLDCLVGASVAASLQGASLLGEQPHGAPTLKAIRMPDSSRGRRRGELRAPVVRGLCGDESGPNWNWSWQTVVCLLEADGKVGQGAGPTTHAGRRYGGGLLNRVLHCAGSHLL